MSFEEDDWQQLQEKIVGLGEHSFRKSYYPELQKKIADLEQFRAILDHSDDAIFMIDTGTGCIVDVSGSACRQLGYDRETLTGKSLDGIIDERAGSAIASLFSGSVQHLDMATTIYGRGDTAIPCEMSVSIARLDGKNIAVAMAHDVSVRKQIGDVLKRSEDTYQAIFNSVNDGIAIMDIETGGTVDVNESLCRMFGYSREEAMSADFISMIAGSHGVTREKALQKLKDIVTGKAVLLEEQVSGASGRQFWIEISLKYGRIRGKGRIIAAARDVTERKKSEEQLKASLKEKEVMLKEIHHRVKNNLQVISSLLSLQSRFLSDPGDVLLFNESQDRVKSMALIHEKLYQSSDLASIDFGSYIERLTTNLFRSYGSSAGRVNLKVDVRDIFLNVDTAIPCGLIINELVTNSLKYAFPCEKEGIVTVAMRIEGGLYTLEVSDDGIGMPPEFDMEHTTSLGLQLVVMLVSQIDGTLVTDRSKGTRYTITFPESSSNP